MAEAETETEEWTKTRGCRKILQTLEGAIEQFKFHSRLTISDDLKVGYFTSDHATQTDCSEIFPLKDLTQSTEKLMRMITSLHVDFGFLKDLVQLKFEDRLKEESWKIVGMLCDKMLELKKHYQQGEEVMRKSFQQQLCDAIAVIKGMYQKFFEIEDEKAALQDAADVKMNVLMRKLKEKEEIVRNLRNELDLYEEFGFKKVDSFAKEPSSPKPISERELLDYRAENERLMQIITVLEDESQAAIKENAILEDELMYLKEISDQDQRTIQKLMDSRDRLRYELDCEKLAIQDMINRQKEDIEIKKKYASIASRYSKVRGTFGKGREASFHVTRQTREGSQFLRPPSASLSVSPKMKKKMSKKFVSATIVPSITDTTLLTLPAPSEMFTSLTPKPSEKHVTFLLPNMVPEELFLKYQLVKEEEKRSLENQVAMLKSALEDEEKRLERLKKDTDQANKSWQKKFLILRNSFHILKNEMFTRQALYRQCAVTGDTSFNYVRVKPLYVHSTVNMGEPSSPPNVPHPPVVEPSYENTHVNRVSNVELSEAEGFWIMMNSRFFSQFVNFVPFCVLTAAS
ncbi:uncharacterized protein C10orf67 homolog, mitochondrial [Grammomys surdaster]|uniref:uncharacterized protein C10orf67 homolog, mitochondrial n=1 Tax=Grammomys surdaster TaxID=491861 RepID=UPI00109F1FE2|nr:uncharacterized protein C10orf67 homolog, mitochondrial [Grammomys surdaster]